MLMAIFSGTAAFSADQMDAIERNTEAWILSDNAKRNLKRHTGVKE